MRLIDLSLENFRSYNNFQLSCSGESILIIGQNAAGKTNIVEAIQLVSMFESFRTSSWLEMIRHKSNNARISAFFEEGDRNLEISLDITPEKGQYIFNGKERSRQYLSEMVSAVLFTPDDLGIIKGISEKRRSLIDDFGKKTSKQYYRIWRDFNKTLQQRNKIIRDIHNCSGFNNYASEAETAWNTNLAALGAQLTIYRFKVFRRLLESASKQYSCLSETEILDGEYLLSCSSEPVNPDLIENRECLQARLLEQMKGKRQEEIARGYTLVGPHRDDIVFLLDGQNTRKFASQGQQRSIALALKLAEVELLQKIRDSYPLLLLDDVLSELDESRRNSLVELCQQGYQSIITTTDVKFIPRELQSQSYLLRLGGQ